MPRIYLSPSLQEYNPFYGGGSEEEVMNLIADAMEPYLAADGIEYLRNAPEMTLGQAIADSNNSNVDFHLAIHSNAAPPSVAGTRRGPVVYYYATSPYGRQMAELIADELREIYPDPSKVQVWMQYCLSTPVMRIFAGEPPGTGSLPPLPSYLPSLAPEI